MDLALNNLQRLICHKPNKPNKPNYLNYGWEDKGLHTFLKGISQKVNVITQLDVTKGFINYKRIYKLQKDI